MGTGEKGKTICTRTRREIARVLLAWYDRSRRDLPWRAPPGERADAYAVWLSEIMLQQTTVKAVQPYFKNFMARWPNAEALASADLDDVLGEWAGLGYYSRARNLHRCARLIVDEHGGRFPQNETALLQLPGIGPYTAAAIAAIAFDSAAAVVDGNVERVIARLSAIETPLESATPILRRLTAELVPQKRPGDFAQAMMDLGATICTVRSPACERCPLGEYCEARAAGKAGLLPIRTPRQAKPVRAGQAFVAMQGDQVLLRKRAARGLLGGMMEVPSSGWSDDDWQNARAGKKSREPLPGDWRRLPGDVRHTFTHFHLKLDVYLLRLDGGDRAASGALPEGWRWVERRDLESQALPSLMRKVLAYALAETVDTEI